MYPSFFRPNDTNCNIDRDHSTVTLACALKGERATRHAQIWIERINENGQLQRFFIELNGPGTNESGRTNRAINGSGSNALIYSTSAQVSVKDRSNISAPRVWPNHLSWSCNPLKVQEMVEAAKLEANNPIAYPRAFNICGSRSIFSRNVESYQTLDTFLQQLLISNKKLFKYLYKTAKDVIEHPPHKPSHYCTCHMSIFNEPSFIPPISSFLKNEKGVFVEAFVIDVLLDEYVEGEGVIFPPLPSNLFLKWKTYLNDVQIQTVKNIFRSELFDELTSESLQLILHKMQQNNSEAFKQGMSPFDYQQIQQNNAESFQHYIAPFARKVVERIESKLQEVRGVIRAF